MKEFVSITEAIFVLNNVLPYKNIRDTTSGANYMTKYA